MVLYQATFNDIIYLSNYITRPLCFISVNIFSSVKDVLQISHEVLRKMKQARKVAHLEGRRHMSHRDLPEIW